MLLDEVGIAEREDVEVPDSFMPQASAGFVSCPAVLDDWRVSFPFDQLRARSGRTGKLTPHAGPRRANGVQTPAAAVLVCTDPVASRVTLPGAANAVSPGPRPARVMIATPVPAS